MICGSGTLGPEEFAFSLSNWHVVYTGFATTHQAFFVEFPIFISMGTIPIICFIMPFILKTYGDAIIMPSPYFFD